MEKHKAQRPLFHIHPSWTSLICPFRPTKLMTLLIYNPHVAARPPRYWAFLTRQILGWWRGRKQAAFHTWKLSTLGQPCNNPKTGFAPGWTQPYSGAGLRFFNRSWNAHPRLQMVVWNEKGWDLWTEKSIPQTMHGHQCHCIMTWSGDWVTWEFHHSSQHFLTKFLSSAFLSEVISDYSMLCILVISKTFNISLC